MKLVPLTKGKIAFVDDEDYERVTKYSWQATCLMGIWYAHAMIDRHHWYMHHYILQSHDRIDHKDRNGLNNCRSNMRKATRSQNRANAKAHENCASRFKGVSRYSKGNRWISRIGFEGHSNYLGIFETEEEAAQAYDLAAIDLFGEFALTNRELGLYDR